MIGERDMDGGETMSRGGFTRRTFLKGGGVGLAGAALLGVAGCGQQESEAEGGDSGGLVDRGDINIEMPTHMIPPDPNTAIMQNGAERAASDLGVNIEFRGPDNFSIPDIQRIFETSIAAGPDAIAATLPDADALGPLIQEAVDEGIAVVLFNAGLDEWEELGALTYVGQTEYEAGVAAGERMAEAGVTNAICVNHQQGQLTLETRFEGFREGMGGNATQVAVDGNDSTQLRNGVETALRQNQDANGLLTLGPDAGIQAMRAAEEAGRAGSMTLATFDISPQVLEAVQSEDMLFAIDQQMFFQTYQAAFSLVNYVQYRLRPVEAVPSGPLFITSGDAGEILELSDQGIH